MSLKPVQIRLILLIALIAPPALAGPVTLNFAVPASFLCLAS